MMFDEQLTAPPQPPSMQSIIETLMADNEELEDHIQLLNERYAELVEHLKTLFRVDRAEIFDRIVRNVLADLHRQPGMSDDEGCDQSLFEFWGTLRVEGGDNILYSIADNMLSDAILEQVEKLEDDEKIVLLTPICDEVIDADERQLEDLPGIMLYHHRDEISSAFTPHILERIPERYNEDIWGTNDDDNDSDDGDEPLIDEVIEMSAHKPHTATSDKLSVDQQITADKALYQSVIDKTVITNDGLGILSPELGNMLEAAYHRHAGNPEMDALLERAANAYADAGIAASDIFLKSE